MALSSMTGFARSAGVFDSLHWQWEIKSVNGKALDIRCRLPTGFEGLEPALRSEAAAKLKRGNLQVALIVSGTERAEAVRLNEQVLADVLAAGEKLRNMIGGEPLRADMILGLRGVLESVSAEEDESRHEARDRALLASYGAALDQLAASRREEGARLAELLAGQIDRIESLTQAAKAHPARSVDAVKARLREQVQKLLETGASFDPDRLHQEALLLATRADIQEEIDRLFSHVEAGRALLSSKEAVGRKLDFLAQEFNREANTLCSKSADTSLTAIGLDLKTVIDQLREQVQNIE